MSNKHKHNKNITPMVHVTQWLGLFALVILFITFIAYKQSPLSEVATAEQINFFNWLYKSVTCQPGGTSSDAVCNILNDPNNKFNFEWIREYKNILILGIKYTLGSSLASFLISLFFGIILFLMTQSKFELLKKIARLITEIAMGTPLLVLVIIGHYFIAPAFNIDNPLLAGILSISFYSGPYIANILNGAVKSIDREQFILLDLYAFNTFNKYVFIIFPQIIKQIMPGMIGNLSMIIKGSALLYAISIPEIFQQIKIIQSKTFAFTEGYLVLWLVYLSITIPLSLIANYFQKRLSQ